MYDKIAWLPKTNGYELKVQYYTDYKLNTKDFFILGFWSQR